MSSIFGVILLGFGFVMAGCGPLEETSSKAKVDLPIPIETDKVDKIKSAIGKVTGVVDEDNKEVSFADFLYRFDIPEKYLPYVDKMIENRDEFFSLDCEGRYCKSFSHGQPVNFKIKGMKIPGLGSPNVLISDVITINFRINKEATMLEVCEIKGIKVQQGLVHVNIDGFLASIEDEKPRVVADVGPSGSYPSKDCVL